MPQRNPDWFRPEFTIRKPIGVNLSNRSSCLRIAAMQTPPVVASTPLPLCAINERDIDLILLTAIHWSTAFRAALVKRVSGLAIAEFIGARREVYTDEGETGLILEVRTEGGERLTIIIQAKIDPSFRLKQSERCRSRGQEGKALGLWDRFITCLCAPKAYTSFYVNAGDWDHVLLLEDAAEDLAIHNEPFASFLCAAMRQTTGEWERDGHIASLKVTAFWTRYADLCRQEFPDLPMARPHVGTLSNDLMPKFLASLLPPGVWLEHKAVKGQVDLSFQKHDAAEIAEKLGDALPHDLGICSAGRSAILRANVPRLVATDPFEPQVEAVRASLKAVRRLAQLWPVVGRRIGYDPKLDILQEPLASIPKLAANLLHSRRFFRD
jgi:hypothetical protein